MEFSVVMPSYKTDKVIVRRAIDSVLKQTFDDFEVVIVDDNNENEYKLSNRELVKEYKDKPVRFIFHDKNLGANPARNTGVMNANGDYIAFLDSDDEWNCNYLLSLHKYITETGKNLYSTNYQLVREYGTCPPVFKKNIQKSGYIFEKEIYGDLLGPTSTVCVRRSSLIEAGLFDVNLPARQDFDMWLRVCKSNECIFVFAPLVLFYKNGKETISSSSERYIRGSEIVLQKILNDPDVPQKLHRSIRSSHYRQIAHGCITVRDFKNCRRFIIKALKNKFSIRLIGWYTLSLFPILFNKIIDIRNWANAHYYSKW